MNDTSRPPITPRVEDYPHRVTETVRFFDVDINGHVNNAVFATYFEAGRVDINRLRTQHLVPSGMSFMLARVAIDYKAEINFPGSVEVATAVARIGKSSITYAQALFFEGHCAATAECISVLVNRATRRSAEIPADLRAHYEGWLKTGG